jgi:hypothetical protein
MITFITENINEIGLIISLLGTIISLVTLIVALYIRRKVTNIKKLQELL